MGIPIIMAIRRRKVGNAVYLEEYKSHRVKGKVVTDFVRYVGREDNEKRVMEPVRIIERVRPSGSTRSGDVDLLWAMAQDLEIPGIIGQNSLAIYNTWHHDPSDHPRTQSGNRSFPLLQVSSSPHPHSSVRFSR